MRSVTRKAEKPAHPLQFTGACLAAHRLEVHYRFEGTGHIRSARLLGPGVDVALTTTTPGLLHTEVPGKGGHFVLWVEAVSDAPPGAPPLPWKVGLFLKPSELADYLAAQPLGAAIDLPAGAVLTIDRLLRRGRSSIFFWSASLGETGHVIDGDLGGDLLEGCEHRYQTVSNYGRRKPHSWVRPATEAQPIPSVEIRVNAVEHGLLDGGKPLVWCGPYGTLFVPTDFRSDLVVPPERPAVLAPDADFALGEVVIRLQEVWLGRTLTLVVFGGDIRKANLLEGLSLQDDLGGIYRPIPDIYEANTRQFTFKPIPASVSCLVVKCEGAGRRVWEKYQIPLEAGARGYAVAEPSKVRERQISQ